MGFTGFPGVVNDISGLYSVLWGFHLLLLVFVHFFLDFTGFYRVSFSFTGFYRVLLGFTGFCWV